MSRINNYVRVGEYPSNLHAESVQVRSPRDFTVWKKCWLPSNSRLKHDFVLVELLITKGTLLNVASGSHINERKCRARRATVLGIYSPSGKKLKIKAARARRKSTFLYKVGDTKVVRNFDKTPSICEAGIHFFFEKKEAVEYDWT